MIEVTFIAKVIIAPHPKLLKVLMQAAESIDGFVSIESEHSLQDGVLIEKTVSVWRDDIALLSWSNHPLHQVAKYRAKLYYASYTIEKQVLNQ